MHVPQQGSNGLGLRLGGDLAGVGGLLEARDAVGVLDDVEDQIGDVRDRHSQSGGHLGQERTQRGDDTLVARAAQVLVVFHCVHDRDHHDQVEAVLPEVCEHVADSDQDEFEVAGLQEQTRKQHDEVTDHGYRHQYAHELFAVDTAGNGRIKDHQEGRDDHAEHLERSKEDALIPEFHIDIGLSDAGHDDAVADLLDQEDQRDPHELIVACDGADDLLEADGRDRVVVIASLLLDAEYCKGEKDRRQDRDDQRDAPIGRHSVAAEGVLAGRQHGDKGARQRAADAGEKRGPRSIPVAGIGVGAQRRHHAPVGDIVHRVGDAVHKVDKAKEPHEGPALQMHVEGQVDDQRGRQDADHKPGLELTPARTGVLDDVAHDGVVERVKDARADHDRRDGRKLRRRELVREEHKGEQITRDEVVDHVSPDGAEREHEQIAFGNFCVFHGEAPFSFGIT